MNENIKCIKKYIAILWGKKIMGIAMTGVRFRINPVLHMLNLLLGVM